MNINSHEAWANEAILEGIHPSVVGYINAYKSRIDFNNMNRWGSVSDILALNESLDRKQMLVKLALGQRESSSFFSYCEPMSVDFDPQVVLAGGISTYKRSAWYYEYPVVVSLCYALRDQNQQFKDGKITELQYTHGLGNFFTFLLDNCSPENSIMGARVSMGVMRLPCDFKNANKSDAAAFTKFVDYYKCLLLA